MNAGTKNDIAKRLELINYLVETSMNEDVITTDLEDCLIDFMEDNFNVLLEDNSAKEIAIILLRVRSELLESVLAK